MSLPPVPRPLMLALCALWWIYFAAGIFIEGITSPQQVWWLDVWKGGLGGNGFSAFGASVLGIILTVEVIIMVFTWAENQRRKMRAAEDAARQAEQAAKEARVEERQKWQQWLESVQPDLDAGRPPSVPPPGGDNRNP